MKIAVMGNKYGFHILDKESPDRIIYKLFPSIMNRTVEKTDTDDDVYVDHPTFNSIFNFVETEVCDDYIIKDSIDGVGDLIEADDCVLIFGGSNNIISMLTVCDELLNYNHNGIIASAAVNEAVFETLKKKAFKTITYEEFKGK